MLQTAELRKPGSETVAVPEDAPVRDVITQFRDHPSLRILPVLNRERQPVGAFLERDVRALLFNPYGHALMQNRSFGQLLRSMIKPCPAVEIRSDLGEVLTRYALADGREGIILTDNGHYFGVIENRELVSAAGAYELDRLRNREEQLNVLRQAGQSFQSEIGALASTFAQLACDLDLSASETARRGEETGQRALAVSASAGQTGETLSALAGHGADHVETLSHLQGETARARASASVARGLVSESLRRSGAFRKSADSIERMTSLIENLAARVNMLAVNAAIEAARAGDAGNGFAIVAREVRTLAGQTRSAAEEIRNHSAVLNSMAADVVAGHVGMDDVVSSIEGIAETVDVAVQAQRARSVLIAEEVEQAANASHEINLNVQGINNSARAAASGATELKAVAQSLTGSSQKLGERVERFLDAVRNAV